MFRLWYAYRLKKGFTVHYCLAGTFFVEACGKARFRAEGEYIYPTSRIKICILFACSQKMRKTGFCLHCNESFFGLKQTKNFNSAKKKTLAVLKKMHTSHILNWHTEWENHELIRLKSDGFIINSFQHFFYLKTLNLHANSE